MRKGRGKYWYKEGDYKNPFNKCDCGEFKHVSAKKCTKCAGLNLDGTLMRKEDSKKRTKSGGYVYIYLPNHHRAMATGYVGEHIVILEKKLGRELLSNEIPHHINEVRDDNRVENLMVMTYDEHNKYHNPKTGRDEKYTPLGKGTSFGHKHNLCECGVMKDARAKRCKDCHFKIKREKKYILED